MMENQIEAYKMLTLDSEDKVIAAYSTMKSRYNRMITRMKKILYAWMTEYEITDVMTVQRYWPLLERELRAELDTELEYRWEDIKDLMIEIFTFNYLYAMDLEGWEQNEDDEDNLDSLAILALLGIAWAADGLTLQERMNKRKLQLLSEVRKILIQQIAIGVPKTKIWDAVLHEINKPKYRGSTQITDEAEFIANEAVRQAAEPRTEGYIVSEILDYRTCKLCRAMHGKQFTWEEYHVGLTAPQFHPRCRGRAIPKRIK